MAVKRKAKKMVVKRKPAKKKTVTRKPAKRKAAKKPVVKKTAIKKAPKGVIGVVTHFFPHVNAAVIKLKAPLSIGDSIKIKGHTTEFTEIVTSMQVDHVPVEKAKKGEEIGLLVPTRVRRKDLVFKA